MAAHAAAYLGERIAAAIDAHGQCHLALAGGKTPELTYRAMRELPIDWTKLHIWFGDERCLPAGHVDRNDAMARQALLKHVPIPRAQIHSMCAEYGPADAAANYSELLSAITRLDIILLGLGEDGHAASLFPGNAALALHAPAVPVFNAPKPPRERVSLSIDTIRAAGERIVLVAGVGKQDALARILAAEALPAAMVGTATWFVDDAAYGT